MGSLSWYVYKRSDGVIDVSYTDPAGRIAGGDSAIKVTFPNEVEWQDAARMITPEWFDIAKTRQAESGRTEFQYNENFGIPEPPAPPTPEEAAAAETAQIAATPPGWQDIPASTSPYTPPWYDPNAWIPTATPSPQVEFMEAINRLMPTMSPQDYQPWLSYLRTQQPDVFTGYTPENIAQYQAPQRTPEQERALNVPERYDQAKGTLFGTGGIIDPDSPAREWLNSIFSTGQQLAPKTAAPESAPSKMQQQDIWRLLGGVQEGTGLLGSPTSYGVSKEQAALWQPWLEQFLAPTTRNLPNYLPSNAPSWLASSGTQAPKTSVSRAGTWANPRWL